MWSGQGSGDSWRRHVWVLPAALGAMATGYLSWGAWITAHNPRWLYLSQAWWRISLRPEQDWTLLATAAVWLAGLAAYWWPRRLQRQPIGLITVVAMVMIGGVLGTASLVPCRGGMTKTAIIAWILGLYVGQPPPSAYPSQACPGQQPLALQLGQIVCLGATLIGALAVGAALWRQPVGRLRSRFARDATVFTGLDALTIPVLKRLAGTGNPRNIIVIEPDETHPLLEEARLTGARVIIGDPASPRLLQPIISGWRGCALSYLYALGSEAAGNEAILAAAARTLCRYRPDPERQPHLVARIDDPRHADYWRGTHSGASSMWFEDALSSAESTACTLVNRVLRAGARQLVLCGDSSLALAILLELARRAWEETELVKAAAIGRGAEPAATSPGDGQPPRPAPLPVERVVLMDPRSGDMRREYLATAPQAVLDSVPVVVAHPALWRDHLLAALDAMAPAAVRRTAVIIVDSVPESSMHEAGRVARLHPDTPVFVQASSGEGMTGAIFDLLHPFQPGLLVDGEVPEDTWTRVARHWHECFRLRRPVAPGDPKTYGRRPWADLDEFIRQDNILQLRSILSAVAARGRQWVPVRMVPPGSFIELTDRDLEEVAIAEHTRWYRRRLAAGWTAAAGEDGAARRKVRTNDSVVPWSELPPGQRAEVREYLRSQLAQLEDVGFVAIVPLGGPPAAASYQRIGVVQARKLSARHTWTRRSGEELSGDAGDWRVLDRFGEVRTVADTEFRASHDPLGGELWRRVGTYRAWQVSEDLVIRTKEGRATAGPGDWVVEGPLGERWPVSDQQFRRTYQASGVTSPGSAAG